MATPSGSLGTLPRGCQRYWRSGCNVQPAASCRNSTPSELGVLAGGFVSSFVVALLSVKFLLAFVRTHTFIPFGVYRIAVALAFALI